MSADLPTQLTRRAGLSPVRLMWMVIVMTAAIPLLSGCGLLPAWSTTSSEAVEPVMVVEERTEVAQEDAVGATPRFAWQGVLEDGSCGQVLVSADGVGGVSPCSDPDQMTAWLPIHQREWEQIESHFGELAYLEGDESMHLYGMGSVEDELWAAAVGAWARFVYLEASTGRSSSAGRTALAWQQADLPGDVDAEADQCGRLLVLRYGYAYALVEPCAGGGSSDPLAEGWLTTDEMGQLSEWLHSWGALYADAGYLDGQGDAEPGADAAAAVDAWTAAVLTRMINE